MKSKHFQRWKWQHPSFPIHLQFSPIGAAFSRSVSRPNSCLFSESDRIKHVFSVRELLGNTGPVFDCGWIVSLLDCLPSPDSYLNKWFVVVLSVSSAVTDPYHRLKRPWCVVTSSSAPPAASSWQPCSLVPLWAGCSGRPHRLWCPAGMTTKI